MKRLTLSLIALALAAGAAQAAGHHHRPLRHRVAYHHRRHVRPLHLTAEMRDDGRRSPALDPAALRRDGYLNPAVSHPLGRGAYASFGYQPGVVRPMQQGELNGAADTRLSHSESAAGVKVGIPF